MTTLPLKEPYRQSAYLYDGEKMLALVRCQLNPPDAPVSGVAQVPAGRDWLAPQTLTLILQRDNQTYRIIATRLERADGAPTLMHFNVIG